MAKGIIMAQERCGPEEAFDRLRLRSQAEHRKVREIAQELVDTISDGAREEPSDGS